MVDPGPNVSPAASLGEACASIARVVAESLDLDQVIDPVAAAVRMIVPFDGMGVWHAEAPDDPLRLTLGPSPDIPSGGRPLRRSDHSPHLWPRPGEGPLVVAEAARVWTTPSAPTGSSSAVVIDRCSSFRSTATRDRCCR
jgi:hypothetical protein